MFSTELDISTRFQSGPSQPVCQFPSKNFGKGKHSCRRSFVATWYTTYPWLEYSIKFDRAYCFACRHYCLGSASGRQNVIRVLTPVKAAFPHLISALQIALTVGVTSASCERTFSSLKRLKTYTRQSMLQSRMNSLAILTIEKDVVETLDLERVVTKFASLEFGRCRRLSLVSKSTKF